MAVLIHFIFSLFKIAILASGYALLIVLTLKLTSPKRLPKKKIWFASGAIISVCLFIFMFTHWGDHGLGDSARIPLKYGREVNQTDGYWTYITPEGYEYEVLTLQQFSYTDEFLIGVVDEPKIAKYAIWDLSSNKVEFTNELGPKYSRITFQKFFSHYQDYWGGWRFWLLA